jgi:hypothetical protein
MGKRNWFSGSFGLSEGISGCLKNTVVADPGFLPNRLQGDSVENGSVASILQIYLRYVASKEVELRNNYCSSFIRIMTILSYFCLRVGKYSPDVLRAIIF